MENLKEKMKKPTIQFKRKLLAKKLLESTGNMGKAMEACGYKPGYCKNPQDLTRSKSWQELMDKYIPLEKIAQTHNRLFDAERPVIVAGGVAMYPDNDVQARAVDLGHKLHGNYAPEKVEDVTPYAGLSNAELLAKEKELTARLSKKVKK